jgi:tryptophan synthase alpha chain
MNAIDAIFARLRSQGRKAFIAFLTACDPDRDSAVQLASSLPRHGAHLLEIGFPYSDPIADGPVMQASYTRVLDRGVRLDDVFSCVRQIAQTPAISSAGMPLVAMTSYSLILRRGPERFLAQAQEAGLSGAIVPDLPLEESDAIGRLAASRDFKLIQLVTPATPPDRARAIAERSTGFLYCVSIMGITGERERLPEELLTQLAWLRRHTSLPLCVGFGVSRPEHVRMLRDAVDGIIVASALVRQVERAGTVPLEEIGRSLGTLTQTLAAALNPGTEA